MAEIGVGFAIAAATATSTEAGKHLVTKSYGVIERVLDFPEIVEDLKTKAQTLEAQQEDLELSINVSKNDNQVIKKIVTNWLVKVDVAVEDVKSLIDKAANPSWRNTLNPFHRNKVCKKALKMIRVIEVLLEEKKQFVEVGDPRPFQSFDIFSNGEFEAFASREDTTKKVVGALQNTQVSMIGIFGMPGVGKTMLMEAIRKQAKDEKLFDEVVLVTVSQNPDIRTIQRNIAEQLGVDLGESPIDVAATKLLARLNQGKKVLVALDDIWERLEMKVVGIPYRSSIQGCKVLFTTRSEEICDRMEVQEKIEVGLLSDSDALKLFLQKVGDVVDCFSNQEIVSDVFNECKRLPLAIVTLGLALRNKDEDEWVDAHTQLKESTYKDMGPVISKVKLSYDFLREYKAAQMCFLFCSLFPEDFQIETDVVLSYMLGEDLLENVDNMEKARKRLHTTVNRLTLSGLLLRSEEGEIMMHDIIRDAAICIASKEGEGFIVKSGLGLKEWPPIAREMGNCKRLSLTSNNLRSGLPLKITASILLTLSLSGNRNLEEVPSDLFNEMKHLKTLDLSDTGIRSLPQSFKCLESLHTLLMDDCPNLVEISLAGELKNLEILSIFKCRNVEIPVSMQKLTKLKMLRASPTIGQVPSEVISSLCLLEELYMLHNYNRRSSLDLSFPEVASLNHLTILKVNFAVECFRKDFPSHWANLSKFSIAVGGERASNLYISYNIISPMKFHTKMYLNLGSLFPNSASPIPNSNWVAMLLEKVEQLVVKDGNHLANFVDLNAKGLYNNLRVLDVSSCEEMRYVLSTCAGMTKAGKPLFSNLDILFLSDLVKFVGICDGPLPEGFLSKLRVLHVEKCHNMPILIPFDLQENLQKLEDIKVRDCAGLEKLVQFEGSVSKQPPSPVFPCLRKLYIANCDNLKFVLPVKAARDLLQLEKLQVWRCSNVETIFEDDGKNANEDRVTLPGLKYLDLIGLPGLLSFGAPGLLVDMPALRGVRVRSCWNLKKLPWGKHNVPKDIRWLKVSAGWLDGLEWEDESFKALTKSFSGLIQYRIEIS